MIISGFLNSYSKSQNLRVALRKATLTPIACQAVWRLHVHEISREIAGPMSSLLYSPWLWIPHVICSLLSSRLQNSPVAGAEIMNSYWLLHTLLRHLWTTMKEILCFFASLFQKFKFKKLNLEQNSLWFLLGFQCYWVT